MARREADHYNPHDQSRKRQRVELYDISQSREFSNSYRQRPDGDDTRNERVDVQDRSHHRRHDNPQHRTDSNTGSSISNPVDKNSKPRRISPADDSSSAANTNTKTKHERKHNPSTQIHSLRRLLSRTDTKMPATIRQEKERELTALLLDQEKTRLKTANRKNLQKYHMVRFFERQKAERTLKRLMKQRDELLQELDEDASRQQQHDRKKDNGDETKNLSDSEDEEAGGGGMQIDSKSGPRNQLQKGKDTTENGKSLKLLKQINREIHTTNVDVAYTIYAPLGAKYISVYAEAPKASHKPSTKKNVYNMFSAAEQQELRYIEDDTSDVLRSAGGEKPPMWFEIEKYVKMRDGVDDDDGGGDLDGGSEESSKSNKKNSKKAGRYDSSKSGKADSDEQRRRGQQLLNNLRDGKTGTNTITTTSTTNGVKIGTSRDLAAVGGKGEATRRSGEKRKASFLEEDGTIDTADVEVDGEDEDMSDGDGGFFER